MQLAGVDCGICHEGVAVENEATWCAACGTVLHRACIASTLNHCPACWRPYDPPEQHFVYSAVCPECASPNTARLPRCARCYARTRWDDAAGYEEFYAHMRRVARRYFIRGLLELAGAGLCLLALLSFFFGPEGHYPLGWIVGGLMFLTADGIITLLKSRTIARFR